MFLDQILSVVQALELVGLVQCVFILVLVILPGPLMFVCALKALTHARARSHQGRILSLLAAGMSIICAVLGVALLRDMKMF